MACKGWPRCCLRKQFIGMLPAPYVQPRISPSRHRVHCCVCCRSTYVPGTLAGITVHRMPEVESATCSNELQ